MRKIFTLIFICFIILTKPIIVAAQVNVQDSLALVALYNSTDGPHWKNNSGWLNSTVENWWGIVTFNSRVVRLVLNDNNLTGSIPPEIGNITDLNFLQLDNNQLSGNIPYQIGNLSNLIELYLNNNQLSGSIPPQIGNLSRLNFLYLNNNQLSGSIPSQISNLSDLQYLFLNNNLLTGSIPAGIGELVHLARLYLNNNKLSGRIPETFALSHQFFHIFDVSTNQLSGKIPEIAFKDFFIKHNRFTYDELEVLKRNKNATFIQRSVFPQRKIALHRNRNMLFVSAGGTLSHNKYRWHKDGVYLTTIYGDSNFIVTTPGIYTVTVVNTKVAGFELYSVRDTITQVPSDGKLAADNYNKQLFNIYPNPAKGFLNISLQKATLNSYVLLYSMDGKQVLKQPVTSSQLHINISGITAGNYELVLAEENKIKYTYPVVITR